MASNGIFCLEGEWDSDLRRRRSVLPILELLERLRLAKFIHRDVSSASEAHGYLKRWNQKRYDDYTVLYVAAHGEKDRIVWSHRDSSTLPELASILREVETSGCYIYFGTCMTLFDDTTAMDFVKTSGAAAVMGYRRNVDWLEAAAFELVLLPFVAAHYGRPQTVLTQLMRAHGDLAKHLDFVVATKTKVHRARARKSP
jgi:hypothetical protein